MSCFNKDEKRLLDQIAGSRVGGNLLEEKICETGVKSYTFSGISATSGIYYLGGYYDAPATSTTLTQASTTQVYGTANVAYAAHAFIVASGAGSTDSGDLVLTVTGTSINDLGTRILSDSEVVVIDCTSVSTNQFLETRKKWIGQITYTLSSSTGTAFSFAFNYGFNKYDDIENSDFIITGFEAVGLGNANDSGFDIQLLHHKFSGWTYHATTFVPGAGELAGMKTDHGTESQVANGIQFAYKRTELSTEVHGSESEGFIIKVITGTSNSINFMDAHVGFAKLSR
jgi:hypothetical protein